ncbi:DUF1349 domain-containing protein [Nocardiopsis salina]|uniref:DUF1349 domain-containing protein n=1 Tax=Nocardiopsis salina TaxID=245836 RepID=UPI000369FC4E|nr:DUF1349 domain-containing protein [Nocardiopsis salina]
MEDIIMYRDDVGACFGLSKWSWFNPPKLWEPEGDGLVVEAASDSDFWVTTYYGFVRDTGHALLRRVPADFSMSTTFRGDYREQYDQAGLLLRLDGQNWIKTGIEYVDGRQYISAVVTRDVSDWSVVPLEKSRAADEVSVKMRRAGDTVTISYGFGEDEPEMLLRLAYFPQGVDADAGIMCAAPQGKGFKTRFTSLKLHQ